MHMEMKLFLPGGCLGPPLTFLSPSHGDINCWRIFDIESGTVFGEWACMVKNQQCHFWWYLFLIALVMFQMNPATYSCSKRSISVISTLIAGESISTREMMGLKQMIEVYNSMIIAIVMHSNQWGSVSFHPPPCLQNLHLECFGRIDTGPIYFNDTYSQYTRKHVVLLLIWIICHKHWFEKSSLKGVGILLIVFDWNLEYYLPFLFTIFIFC